MLNIIKENKKLSECLLTIFDFEILDDFKEPDDADGHLTYNIAGKTFGICGDGSEYILLDDGSIGYWGSEGQTGRISDSIDEFFEFIINCPYWQDYVRKEMYINNAVLSSFAKGAFEKLMTAMKEDNIDLIKKQRYVAEKLGIKLYGNGAIELLTRFYTSANREPKFYSEYKEDDGSKNISSGTLF
ncbi:MAG: hypothetical protein N4A48_13245 [Tepidibacter sp.]|jgi:hypothetical protein|uniref:hypothetical protein n=1 Tax=Tepidibacter sp. TaxID=2529387 RepID=UPI0025F0F9A7|nr:hypothetical protein [Tepidibacter sp.]MCT4509697.1 hypothetical protein [Tepidibacter sp.]